MLVRLRKFTDNLELAAVIAAIMLVLTLFAVSVSAQGNSNRQVVCHRTGSANNPTVTLSVAGAAVPAHILHGDTLGPCSPGDEPQPDPDPDPTVIVDDPNDPGGPTGPPVPGVTVIPPGTGFANCFLFSEAHQGDLIRVTNLDRFRAGSCEFELFIPKFSWTEETPLVVPVEKSGIRVPDGFDGFVQVRCPFDAAAVQFAIRRGSAFGFAIREPQICVR